MSELCGLRDNPEKSALVTGGAGFIGSRMVGVLLKNGWSVRVLDNFSGGSRGALEPYLNEKGFSLVEGDVADRSVLRGAISGAGVVFHLAAFVSVPLSVEKPEECFRTNVAAFEILLQELRETKTPLIYASSAAVYGDRSEGRRREDEPPQPLSPYGASKAINEIQALAAWNTWGVPSVGFRFFNVYGEGQNVRGAYASVIPKFCEAVIKGIPPVIFGDGEQTRDFIYVGDVAEILLGFVPLIKSNSGGVFNVASGESQSVRGVLDRLRTMENTAITEKILPVRADDVRHSRADLSKITSVLNRYTIMDFGDGLKKTFEWYKNNL